MLFMQGMFWLLSLILHFVYVPVLENMTRARWALANGHMNNGKCICDPCDFTNIEDEVSRAQAKRICDAACQQKCP